MRLACAAAAIALMIANSEAASAPKQIVFLHSYSQDFKPWSEHAKALRKELDLESDWPLFIENFSVVTGRTNDDENAELNFVGYLSALFSARPPDLIITFGGPAAAFCSTAQARTLSDGTCAIDGGGPATSRGDGPNGERRRRCR
jgi:hypothetical protein